MNFNLGVKSSTLSLILNNLIIYSWVSAIFWDPIGPHWTPLVGKMVATRWVAPAPNGAPLGKMVATRWLVSEASLKLWGEMQSVSC